MLWNSRAFHEWNDYNLINNDGNSITQRYGRLSDIIDNAINEFGNSWQDFYTERAAAKSDENDTLIVIGNYDEKTNELFRLLWEGSFFMNVNRMLISKYIYRSLS